jgi:hypothetical protein
MQTNAVFIYSKDICICAYQFTQSQSECPSTSAEVRPGAALNKVRRFEEVDMIGVVHDGNGIIGFSIMDGQKLR